MDKECPKCKTINHYHHTLDMYPPIYCFSCNCGNIYKHRNSMEEENKLKLQKKGIYAT